MPEAAKSGILQQKLGKSPDYHGAVIDGQTYGITEKAAGFIKFIKIDTQVDFKASPDANDRMVISWIAKVKEEGGEKPEVKTAAEIQKERRYKVTVTGFTVANISFIPEEGPQRNKTAIAITPKQHDIMEEWHLDTLFPVEHCEITWDLSGTMTGLWVPGINMPGDLPPVKCGKEELAQNLPEKEPVKPKEPEKIVEPIKPQQQTIDSTSPSPVAAPRSSRITIACTINLQGYESLKVAIDGEASDRDQLKAYLIDTLHGFGQKDQLTKDQINQYIARVLAGVS